MELVYVFLVEGTVYTCDKQSAQATLTQREWDVLDRTQQYVIENGVLVVAPQKVQETVAPVEMPKIAPEPMPLVFMYQQAGVGEVERLDAVWDILMNQDFTKANELTQKRKLVEQERKRQVEEYEAGKR